MVVTSQNVFMGMMTYTTEPRNVGTANRVQVVRVRGFRSQVSRVKFFASVKESCQLFTVEDQ